MTEMKYQLCTTLCACVNGMSDSCCPERDASADAVFIALTVRNSSDVLLRNGKYLREIFERT